MATDTNGTGRIGSDVRLHVENLSKTYRGIAGAVEAVRSLTFDLHQGEFACLVGPSGSARRRCSR